MLTYDFNKTRNSPVYKLIMGTVFGTCKNFVSVIGFSVTGFKLGLYSLKMAVLCQNMLE